MATSRIHAAVMDFSAAPAPFLPSAGAEPAVPWPRWISIFENFLLAIGGDKFTAERQRAVLLTCLGTEGQRVHESLPVSVKEEGENEYSFTVRRLKEHFEPKRNVCAERYGFVAARSSRESPCFSGCLRSVSWPVHVSMAAGRTSFFETS